MAPIRISADKTIRKLMLVLLSVELLILLLDLTISHHGLGQWPTEARRVLNIAREDGIVTWFTSTLTFMVAMVLSVLYFRYRVEGQSHAFLWAAMAVFFLYTAADDAAKIHERVGSILTVSAAKSHLEAIRKPGSVSWLNGLLQSFPSYPWQVAFFPVFGSMGGLILYVIGKKVTHRQARLLLLAGLLSLVCAVGLDFIEGLSSHGGFNTVFREENPHLRHYLKAVEETIEMFAFTFLLGGFLLHLAKTFPAWELRIK